MAFDEDLAGRVRDQLESQRGFVEKRMFGGVGFLRHGNMCVGVWKEYLIVRLGPDSHDQVVCEPHVREFDITGRVMKGWAMVEPAGIEDDGELKSWILRAIDFVRTLPRK